MPLPPSKAAPIRFGPFEVYLHAGEIRRYGHLIRLQTQPFRLLAVLLEQPGEVVTRDDLRLRLWGPGVFINLDHSLGTAIGKLRAALGDTAENPKYIETLPKRGFRFIAAVRPPELANPLSATDRPEAAEYVPASKPLPIAPAAVRLPSRLYSRLSAFALIAISCLVIALFATHGTPAISNARPIQSLAVLPLENLSGDPNQELFAEGMTDELITSLAKIRSLRVISRTSVMHYRGTRKTVPQIARELGADALVEGTILRSGGRVRITAQLIQGSTDRHLWAEVYEGEAGDVLFLQNQVARDVAGSIHVSLSPVDASTLSAAHEVDPATEDLYWKGIFFVNKLTVPDFKRARDYFQQMIDRDPADARGWSGLAMANHHLGMWGDFAAFPRAESAALKSIELDGSRAEPFAELAMLRYLYDWNLPEAERMFKRAIDINPNYPHTHYYYMLFLAHTGRFDEAIREITLARRLDPQSVNTAAMAWHAYFCARQYDKALQVARDVVTTDPTFASAHFRLGMSFRQKGDYPNAIEEDRLSAIYGGASPKEVGVQFAPLKRAYEREGVPGYWREKLREALQARDPDGHFGTDGVAAIYMNLGDNRKALEWIATGIKAHDPYILFWVPILPEFDPLRDEPQYQKIFAPYHLPVLRKN